MMLLLSSATCSQWGVRVLRPPPSSDLRARGQRPLQRRLELAEGRGQRGLEPVVRVEEILRDVFFRRQDGPEGSAMYFFIGRMKICIFGPLLGSPWGPNFAERCANCMPKSSQKISQIGALATLFVAKIRFTFHVYDGPGGSGLPQIQKEKFPIFDTKKGIYELDSS